MIYGMAASCGLGRLLSTKSQNKVKDRDKLPLDLQAYSMRKAEEKRARKAGKLK
jgi:hypothetical protein